MLFHALELRAPLWLLCALLAVPVYLLGRRAAGRMRFSSLALLPRAGRSWRTRLAFLPELLAALGVVALAVALAGPRVGDKKSRVQRRGIAMVMAVYISGSMAALDLSDGKKEKTRLDAVKEVFQKFAAGRPNDLIGIVSFARYADTRSPLTLDHDSLASAAAALEIVSDRAEDGTALGDGLALAVERLRETKASSRIAILLTDGVQNAGDTEPQTAAELAAREGVKVYTIGAGTNGVAPIRATDPFSGRSVLTRMPVEIDEATLKAVADKTGGKYFRATDAAALAGIYKEIDGLERTKFEDEKFGEYHEYYAEATALGLILVSLGWLAGATLFRRSP